MPLTVKQPAKEVAAVIRGQLESMATDNQFRTAQLRTAAPAALSLAAPHPVYNLNLDDVGAANALGKAKLTAWRYVVLDGERSIATAEALPASAAKKPVFSQTNEGPLATSFGNAITVAERLPELADQTYELALLRIPALHVTALWLRSSLRDSFADDLFMPLNPAPAGLKAEEKLDADAFLKALTGLKAERGVTEGTSN